MESAGSPKIRASPPVMLGGGARLFADTGVAKLEPVQVVGSPRVTHVRYRFAR